MKGKTSKSAMRGGGMARKGTGMALKGGGIARKGTGSNAEPGGKTKKMAVGGFTGGEGGKGGEMRNAPRPDMRNVTRPGFTSGPRTVRPGGSTLLPSGYATSGGKPGMGSQKPVGGGKGGPSGGKTIPQDVRNGMNAVGSMPMARKNGGKVAKYAKGGAVKMTAGAGSGSGRLEKVAAHKSAKRVPAQYLKSGGKVKGK